MRLHIGLLALPYYTRGLDQPPLSTAPMLLHPEVCDDIRPAISLLHHHGRRL